MTTVTETLETQATNPQIMMAILQLLNNFVVFYNEFAAGALKSGLVRVHTLSRQHDQRCHRDSQHTRARQFAVLGRVLQIWMHEYEPILGVMHVILPAFQHNDQASIRVMGDELAVPIATIIRSRPPSDHLVGNAICFLANISAVCGDIIPSICTQQLFQSLLSVSQSTEPAATLGKSNIAFLFGAFLEHTSPTNNSAWLSFNEAHQLLLELLKLLTPHPDFHATTKAILTIVRSFLALNPSVTAKLLSTTAISAIQTVLEESQNDEITTLARRALEQLDQHE